MKMREKIDRGRAHARLALDAYQATPGADPDDCYAIGDLIADLLHLHESVDGHADEGADATLRCADLAVEHFVHEGDPAHADEEV